MKQFKILLLTFGLSTLPITAVGYSSDHDERDNSLDTKSQEYYIRGNLGFPVYRKVEEGFKDSTQLAPHGSVAIGARHKKFAVDVEGGYLYLKTRSTTASIYKTKSSLSSKSAFLNLFFCPTLYENKIRAYAGVGVGRAFNDMGNRYSYFNNIKLLGATGLRSRQTVFQGIIGAEYMFNSKISFLTDIRYVYFGMFKQKYNKSTIRTAEKLSIGTVTIGAKYKL